MCHLYREAVSTLGAEADPDCKNVPAAPLLDCKYSHTASQVEKIFAVGIRFRPKVLTGKPLTWDNSDEEELCLEARGHQLLLARTEQEKQTAPAALLWLGFCYTFQVHQSNIHEGSAKSFLGLQAQFQISLGLPDTPQRSDCTGRRKKHGV